ncbi:hypothetical protein GCM10010430_01830 [Kitasatospora cystarginea]|uniref:Uncharacterized protein n=1 Tax=Kitasatospora cystarginea TaxID=58350 RepID=A0ABN3DB86_9ACTN
MPTTTGPPCNGSVPVAREATGTEPVVRRTLPGLGQCQVASLVVWWAPGESPGPFRPVHPSACRLANRIDHLGQLGLLGLLLGFALRARPFPPNAETVLRVKLRE